MFGIICKCQSYVKGNLQAAESITRLSTAGQCPASVEVFSQQTDDFLLIRPHEEHDLSPLQCASPQLIRAMIPQADEKITRLLFAAKMPDQHIRINVRPH